MERPEPGRAFVPRVSAEMHDILTASISSEESESWTLLGKATDLLDKEPSGVQIVKPTNEKEIGTLVEEDLSKRKQRHDSHRSVDSQLDESSDGISVISESDGAGSEKVQVATNPNNDQGRSTIHGRHTINFKQHSYEPLTPPYTPEKVTSQITEEIDKELQVQYTDDKSVEAVQAVVERHQYVPVPFARWIIFSFLGTAMAAIILGNSMRLQNRVNEINFEHEKRISELELENNILKNEMNKLRHLYTRSELDEQVQQAEFVWMEALRQEEEPSLKRNHPVDEEQSVRKVPPQDEGVLRKVVWSGDEEEPMLIVDKEHMLPAFCYNQDQAVPDNLFFEYSTKYCSVKKRKIEEKQKKTQQNRQPKQENYNKFINHKATEHSDTSVRAERTGKPASPFNIDYKKAFDAIKVEGSVIVEALGSILNLSPEPDSSFDANVADSDQVEIKMAVVENFPTPGEQQFAKNRNDHKHRERHTKEQIYIDKENNQNQPEPIGDKRREDMNHSWQEKLRFDKRKDDANRKRFDRDLKQRERDITENSRPNGKYRKRNRKTGEGDRYDNEQQSHHDEKKKKEHQKRYENVRNDHHSSKVNPDRKKFEVGIKEKYQDQDIRLYAHSDQCSSENQKRQGKTHDDSHRGNNYKQQKQLYVQRRHGQRQEQRYNVREQYRQTDTDKTCI